MLLDMISQTKSLIDKNLYAMNNTIRKDELRSINKKLDTLNSSIKRAKYLIKEVTPEIGGNIKLNGDTLRKITTIENHLNNNESTELINSYIKQISKELYEIEEKCKKNWLDYYDENYNDLIGTLSLLRNVIEDDDIKRVRNNLIKYGKKWPVDKRDIEELRIIRETANEKIEDLEMDIEIESFLIKITNRDAKASDLSVDIINWLNKTGAGEFIMLRTSTDIESMKNSSFSNIDR